MCEGKNIRRDGKRSFVNLFICVFNNKITALAKHYLGLAQNNLIIQSKMSSLFPPPRSVVLPLPCPIRLLAPPAMRHARCGGSGTGNGGDDDGNNGDIGSGGGGDSFDLGMAVATATATAIFDGFANATAAVAVAVAVAVVVSDCSFLSLQSFQPRKWSLLFDVIRVAKIAP